MGFWVLLAALVVNLALALVILTRATRASSTAYFGISALFIALWAFGTLLMLLLPGIKRRIASANEHI